MKISDYISVGTIAVVGTIIAYFLMNGIVGDPKDKVVTFEYLANSTSQLVAPDSEIFNSGAINPTVEVYVGSCVDRDGDGVISEEELVLCGEDDEFSTGETTSGDYLEANQGLSNDENEAINQQQGYASGTTAEQRQSVENQINQYQQQQQTQNTQGGTECDFDGDGVVSTAEIARCNAARQETTSE